MSEQNENEPIQTLPPPAKRKLGHKTRKGQVIGRPKRPYTKAEIMPVAPPEVLRSTRKHKIDDSDQVRRAITGFAKMGHTIESIANILGISKSWLEKKYKFELRMGRDMANALVVENLYQQAMKDSPSSIQAGIYITKARMGWKDKPEEEKSSQPSVVFDFSGLDYDERIRLMETIKLRKQNVIEGTAEEIDE
jgi:hypothetical protein